MTQGVGTPFERGRGTIRTIVGTDPGAGVNIVETVPAGVIWLLHAMQFLLVTDANAGNRGVVLRIDDGTDVVLETGPNVTQTASLTYVYTAAAFGVVGPLNTIASLRFAIPLPPNLILPAGYRVRTSVGNLVAGDDLSVPHLLVEEWTL